MIKKMFSSYIYFDSSSIIIITYTRLFSIKTSSCSSTVHV